MTLVHAASVADRAGIAVGDVITRVGTLAAPGPAQVTRAFDALPSGGEAAHRQHLVAQVAAKVQQRARARANGGQPAIAARQH